MIELTTETSGFLLLFVIVASLAVAMLVLNLWRKRVEQQSLSHQRELTKAIKLIRKKELEAVKHTKELEKTKSALLNMMEDLTDSYEKLKELDDLKSDFVISVSHELRTPLTSIILGFELLEKEKNPVKQKEIWELLIRNTQRLQRTINDILKFSAMDSGKVVFRKKQFDLKKVLQNVVAEEKQRIKTGVEFNLLVSSIPLVIGDEEWIHRAVTNLVDNAIKYTNKGQITISAKRQKSYIVVSVMDSGTGIPKKFLPHVFNKFVKPEKQKVGAGVGLWLTKQTIEKHGGRIWIESKKGKGTHVSFTLPIKVKK